MKYLILLLAFAGPAYADDDFIATVTDPLTKAECSACHMAYPAVFLPAASWQKIMNTLPDHFGEDASLPEADARNIEAWLVANAASDRAIGGVDLANPPMRISELPWFKRKHDREVSAKAIARAGSMANCAACHRGAESGYFSDD